MSVDPDYAAYIWSAYALSGAVIALLGADSLLRARRWRREADKRRDDPQ